MNKQLMILACVTAAVYSISFIPKYIINSTSRSDYTYPVIQDYCEYVTAYGKIESLEKSENYIPTAAITKKVFVSVGDTVKKNQLLAEIDIKKTEALLNNSLNISQTLGIAQYDNDNTRELQSLLSAYGISSNSVMQAISKQIPKINMIYKENNTVVPRYITSPINGTVTSLSLKEGTLTPNSLQPVVVVEDTSKFKAVVTIDECDIHKVKISDKAVITGNGFPGKKYEGRVIKIFPSAEQKDFTLNGEQGTGVKAEILIDNTDNKLKDGFSVNVSIISNDVKQVMSIPYEAIEQDEQNQEYVLVYKGGRAIKKEITTGNEMTYSTEIEGLELNDKILLELLNLKENDRVLLENYKEFNSENP